jgi:hypothetical protein
LKREEKASGEKEQEANKLVGKACETARRDY